MRPSARVKSAARTLAGAVVRWSGVVSIAYHRIGDGRESVFDRALWSATAEGLDAQLRWLKRHFDVISPRDLRYVVRVKRGRHVVVTFDDGYADNFTVAYPLLRAHRLPATFFVTTGFIDRPRLPWWDEIAWMVRRSPVASFSLPGWLPCPVACDDPGRARAVRQVLRTYYALPAERTSSFLDALAQATGSGRYQDGCGRLWMTWDMLREMRAGGMTIGGHGVRHEILSRMTADEQRDEIAGCAQRLEQELGVPMRTFSYPVGQPDSFTAATRDCLRRAGVATAFTYCGGFRRISDWDDYDIPRIGVEQETTLDQFRSSVMAPWRLRA